MTQTVAPARVPAPGPTPAASTASPSPAPAASAAPSVGPPTGRLRAGLAGTPGRLRVAAAVAVLGALLVAVLGSAAVAGRASAVADAQGAAAQLVRIQTVRIALVQADADATNAFLVGGLEPADQRADYVASIGLASRTLAQASQDAQADAGALGRVNDALTQYTGLVESARANNRQGFPVGAAYLRRASTLLRTDVLPQLTALAGTTSNQFDDATSRSNTAGTLLVVAVVAGLVLLIGAQLVLALRTRRLLSMPVVFGTLAVIVAAVVAFGAMAWAQGRAGDIRRNQYAAVQALTQARGDAFDAKSNESLTLIARGSGAAYEQAWGDSMQRATATLQQAGAVGVSAGVGESFDRYRQLHLRIRELDDGGKWEDAVALATGRGDDGANAAFAVFAQRSGDELTAVANETDAGLGGTGRWLDLAALLLLVAGLIAAAAAWWGFSIRLDDYR